MREIHQVTNCLGKEEGHSLPRAVPRASTSHTRSLLPASPAPEKLLCMHRSPPPNHLTPKAFWGPSHQVPSSSWKGEGRRREGEGLPSGDQGHIPSMEGSPCQDAGAGLCLACRSHGEPCVTGAEGEPHRDPGCVNTASDEATSLALGEATVMHACPSTMRSGLPYPLPQLLGPPRNSRGKIPLIPGD